MQLSAFISLLKRARVLILVCAIVGAGSGVAYAAHAPARYVATARVEVTADQAATADSTTFDRLMATQVSTAISDPVLRGAIPRLRSATIAQLRATLGAQHAGAPAISTAVRDATARFAAMTPKQLRARISASRLGTTTFIVITGTADTATSAVQLANVIASSAVAYARATAVASLQLQINAVQSQLGQVATELQSLDRQLTGPHPASVDNAVQSAEAQSATLTGQRQTLAIQQATTTGGVGIAESATTGVAAPKGTGIDFALGLFGGAGIALAIALVKEQLDDRVVSSDEAEHFSDARMMSEIPQDPTMREQPRTIPVFDRTDSRFAAAVHRLRSAIDFGTLPSGPRVVSIVSPDDGDGRTTIAVNLAASYAGIGRRVALVTRGDENAAISSLRYSLSEPALVKSRDSDGSEIVATRIPGLSLFPIDVLTSYPPTADTAALIRFLEDNYDVAIIDCPAANRFVDSGVLANAIDRTVLLVNRYGATHGSEARRVAETLRDSGARVLGVVLNHAPNLSRFAPTRPALPRRVDQSVADRRTSLDQHRVKSAIARDTAVRGRSLPWDRDRHQAGSG